MPRSDGPKALPPEGRGTPGASRLDFPIHAGSLGPHRAHAEHSTTITKYSRETRPELWLADYRLACQLGGMDDDNLIIRNLPMFLSDAARAWLEHLPPVQISN
jgi:hypothetical protein